MIVVHKLTVPAYQSTTHVSLPLSYKWLCAREQNNEIAIWYLCDDVPQTVGIEIIVCKTDEKMPCDSWRGLDYIGTTFQDAGGYVFHVFATKV